MVDTEIEIIGKVEENDLVMVTTTYQPELTGESDREAQVTELWKVARDASTRALKM